MRKLVTSIGLLLLMATVAVAAPKPSRTTPPEQSFPATLRNARYVYVAAYDGDQFDPRLLPEDRDAIAAVENAIQKWGKLILVYEPDQADIILLVDAIDLEAADLQHRLGDRAHRHLPRIEVVELAAHAHQQHKRDGAVLQDRKRVDAVTDSARLHKQR